MSEFFLALAVGLPMAVIGSLVVTWFAIRIGYLRFEDANEDKEKDDGSR